MNIICPRCGKDHTIPFSDSVYKTTGFECEDCHQDFGVNDGKTLEDRIRFTNELLFSYTDKKQDTYKVEILKINEKATLKMTKIFKNKMVQPYTPIDFSNEYQGFVEMLYRQLFILDWPRENVGFVTEDAESFEVIIRYTLHAYDDVTITGVNQFPVYFKVLDTLFSSLFLEEGQDEEQKN